MSDVTCKCVHMIYGTAACLLSCDNTFVLYGNAVNTAVPYKSFETITPIAAGGVSAGGVVMAVVGFLTAFVNICRGTQKSV